MAENSPKEVKELTPIPWVNKAVDVLFLPDEGSRLPIKYVIHNIALMLIGGLLYQACRDVPAYSVAVQATFIAGGGTLLAWLTWKK